MKEDRIRVRALPDENMSEDMKRQKERYKEKTTNNTMVFVDLTSTPLHFTELRSSNDTAIQTEQKMINRIAI